MTPSGARDLAPASGESHGGEAEACPEDPPQDPFPMAAAQRLGQGPGRARSANEFLGRPYVYARGRVLWLRTFLRNLGLGSYLAIVAGMINSVAFIAFGSFVSHVSGHATRAAVEYSEGHMRFATSFLLATLLFIGGAVTTTLLLRGQTVEQRTRRFLIPLLLEFGCICYVALFASGGFGRVQTFGGAVESVFIYVLSFAMGLQNALIRQASGTILRTTHMTGIATDIGIALGTAFLTFGNEIRIAWVDAVDRIAHGTEPLARRTLHPLRFAVTVVRAFVRVFRFERFVLHLSIFLSFLVGAMAGTWGFLRFSFPVLYCPAGIIALIISKELRDRRRRRLLLADARVPARKDSDALC